MANIEPSWSTNDELLYLKNIGKSLDLPRLKKTKKDVLEGYIKGIEKRKVFLNKKNLLNKALCIATAQLMIYNLK